MTINQWTQKWAESKNIRSRFYRSTESTNERAKEEFLRDTNQPLSLYLADHQTQGKGRKKHQWLDLGDGNSFLSSWSFKPQSPPQPIITPLLGISLYKSCREIWPKLKWSIKAPNDLLLNNKKVAGLLVETVQQGSEIRIIIGLGMNINKVPKEVEEIATSINRESAPEQVNETLWHQFIDTLLWNTKTAIEDGQLNHLSPTVCEELKNALNENENLKEKIEKVQLDGSISFSNETIPWHKV